MAKLLALGQAEIRNPPHSIWVSTAMAGARALGPSSSLLRRTSKELDGKWSTWNCYLSLTRHTTMPTSAFSFLLSLLGKAQHGTGCLWAEMGCAKGGLASREGGMGAQSGLLRAGFLGGRAGYCAHLPPASGDPPHLLHAMPAGHQEASQSREWDVDEKGSEKL